ARGSLCAENVTVNPSGVALNGHTLLVNSDGSATFNAAITDGTGGPGGLVVNHTRTGGTVTLNAANTYTGATAVEAGTLVLSDRGGATPPTAAPASANNTARPAGPPR